ncbi:MAG: PRC-barrel domain containing protein [Phycisphaerae bacterium]|nr:PRC-barrel domain containing protein [Phycisphaerae bacterium]
MAIGRIYKGSSLLDVNVYNRQDENLGTITEVMVDVDVGCIAYAVLSHGGFLGIGEQLFAVPWAALELDDQREAYVLDVTPAQLEQAPGFQRDEWPDMTDEAWGRRVHEFYHIEPYWQHV